MSLIHEHLEEIELEIKEIFAHNHCVDNFGLHCQIDALERACKEAKRLIEPFNVKEK